MSFVYFCIEFAIDTTVLKAFSGIFTYNGAKIIKWILKLFIPADDDVKTRYYLGKKEKRN